MSRGTKQNYGRLQRDFGRVHCNEEAENGQEFEKQIRRTLTVSKSAFYESEKSRLLSRTEFLFWQISYIRKRWWGLQMLLLVLLWGLLKMSDGGEYVQRCMGALAPVFVILVMPELWKNRESGAVEVEIASYFDLRQVYAARMFAFGMFDLVLLSIFGIAALLTGRLGIGTMVVHFFLPMAVAGCICFRTLCSRFCSSMYPAIAFCLIWEGIWLLLVLDQEIYKMISMPAWSGIFICCVWYLGYAVHKAWKSCEKGEDF